MATTSALTISDWAQIGTAVGTVVLAVATYWMARATKSMAEVSQRSVTLEAEPHLALATLDFSHDDQWEGAAPNVGVIGIYWQVGLRFHNPGKVLVQYRVDDIAVSVDDAVTLPEGQLLNRGGIIHPGAQTVFFYPRISIRRPAGEQDREVRVRIRIAYWSATGQERYMRATISVGIRMFPVTHTPWIFAEGPHYDLTAG